jgi:signal transduction histidine kinase/ActR/RegA family two-component response regulator
MLRTNFMQSSCALIAVGSVAVATILRAVIYIIFHEQIPYTPFYPAVMLTALCCGLTWGLISTTLSALAASFWLAPLGRPLITEMNDLTGMALFLLVCGLLSWLAARVREHRQELELAAAERERLLVAEQAARQQAEHANRAKDDFLAAVTHELRTPLSSILGWVQLMRQHDLPQDEVETAMESIEQSARIQTQLITDLLDLSRVRMGKLRLDMHAVCISDVVESAAQTVLPTAQAKGIEMCLPSGQSVGPVLADTDRLHQVVWNLLSNAIKFTPSDGTICITVADKGEHVELVVADSGEGIDDAFLQMVFDRFQQEESGLHKGGLGLGLAIAKELVELHGGTIRASSSGKGRGAEFTVVLPKVRVPAILQQFENEYVVSPRPLTDTLEGKRILIVDDDADARFVIEKVLRRHGADTIAVDSADEATKLVKSLRVDVLVSDLGMPDVDGIELIRRIRDSDPPQNEPIPAIALTAYTSEQDQLWALASGFQIHLGKPVEPSQLVDAVAELAHVH